MLRRIVLPYTLVAMVALTALAAARAEGIEIRGKVLGPGGLPQPEATVSLHASAPPYRRAEVWFGETQPEPAAAGKTDASGEFLLEAPAAGLWTVRLEAPGLVPLVHRLEPLVEPRVLATARMESDGGLTVHVGGREDKPVAGALVRLFRPASRMDDILRPRGWEADNAAGLTDAEGTVHLHRAESDRRKIVVSATGYRVSSRPTTAGTGMTVRLETGQARRVTVVEQKGEDEVPVAGALVQDRESGQPLGFTGKDGVLSIYPPGGARYAVTVVGEDGRSTTGSGLRLLLPAKATMVGQLIDSASRAPISGGLVWPAGRPWLADTTDRAGGFVLRGTLGDKIRIKADATGYLPADEVPFQFADDGRAGPILPLVLGAAIEGRVVEENGRGVGQASVGIKVKQSTPGMMRIEIGGPPPPRAVTDEHGRFRLSKIDTSNNYDLSASAEGYVKGKTAIIGLEPGRTRRDVRVELERGAQLTGLVLDSEGAPLANASVTIERSTGRRMGGMMLLGGPPEKVQGITDQEGRFALNGLPRGNAEIAIARKGFARLKVPGIDVPGGGEAADLGEFRLEPGARVQGMVVDTDGLPVENAEVRVARGGGPRMMMMGMGDEPPGIEKADAVSGPDGWFTLEDQPGGGEISVDVSREGFLRASARVTQIPNAEPLVVTLDPSSKLSGIVLDPDGQPVAGADISLTRSVTSGAGGMQMKMVTSEGATSDAEGRFEYEGLEPGKVSLAASASGFQETTRDGIEIVKGEDLLDVELPLRAGAVLVGQVLTPDGKPAIDATVSIVRSSPEPDFGIGPGRAATDGGGNYRLEGLPPGPVSIEATHDSYVRTVKDIEAEEGINALDLQFEGGQEVAGSVAGPDGAPVPGATVRMDPVGRQWGGPTADAGADGTFRFPGVADGEYLLTAGAEGFAPPAEKVRVHVGGQPVAGLVVALQGEAALVGRVLGLDPTDFPQVEINAFGGPGQFGESRVDSQGRFRITGLGAGSYSLSGSVGRSGNQARAQATLEPGQAEANVDLEFGQGLVLSGRALLGDKPFTQATVAATGTDVSHVGWGETDAAGAFRLSGLKPGTYEVQVRQWKTGISYEEPVEVTSNRDVELRIPTATISGTVVDTADRKALPGVRVALAPPDGSAETFFEDHVAVTDVNGRFTIGNVADGSWSLISTKKGYAAGRREVVLQMGTGVDNVRLELEPTEGLTLQVRLPSGAIPSTVRAAVLDTAGRTLSNGSYSTGENGSVRLSSVPAGSWDVVLYAPGAAVLRIQADAPGGPVPVQLPRATALSVSVPDLAGSDTRATVMLTDAAGTPFREVEWYGEPVSQWSLRDGERLFETLPPGTWTVRVDAADGRNWQGSGTSAPDNRAEVVLR